MHRPTPHSPDEHDALGARPQLRGAAVFIGTLTAILIIFRLTGLSDMLGLAQIQQRIETFGAIGPGMLILLYALRCVVLIPPASIVSIAGGAMYGVAPGTIFTSLGAASGSCLAFLVARYLAYDFVQQHIPRRVAGINFWVERHGFLAVLWLRLMLVIPFDVQNFACGVTRVSFRDYALASLAGVVPGCFLYALLGTRLIHGTWLQFALVLSGIALLALLPLVLRIALRRRAAPRSSRVDDRLSNGTDCN
jgi:uncharacterized membrane protein YdjX (TVP38/TMEM64 family)